MNTQTTRRALAERKPMPMPNALSCHVNESGKSFVDVSRDPDPLQYLMSSSLACATPLHQVL